MMGQQTGDASAQKSDPVATYEYNYQRISRFDLNDVVASLNALGLDGWQVIWVEHGGGFFSLLLMRQLAPPPPPVEPPPE